MIQFLTAVGAIIVGVIIELYVFQIVRIFGHIGWAEQKLGPGGTYTLWRLIGIAAIIFGFWSFGHTL